MPYDPILNLPIFTDEHRAFAEGVDTFMTREAPIAYALELEQRGGFPDDGVRKMAESGLLGTCVPEEYGGLGLGYLYHAIMLETMSRHCDALAASYSIITWGIHNLIKHGTPEQKEHYLPLALAGTGRFAAGISEPNAGSDAGALSLRAVRDGDDYILNGQKIWTSAAQAEGATIILFTRTDPDAPKHKGITAFLVPNDLPGIDIRSIKVLARNSPGTNEVFFDDVRIPASSMLGGLNKGWEVLGGHLGWERLGLAAQYSGMCRLTTDLSVAYAAERQQFGRRIGEFQVLKHMLADMDTAATAARLMTYNAAWQWENGTGTIKDVSQAKLLATETLQTLATNAMQIFGGYGQVAEYHVERLWRVAKLSTIGGGSSQMQRSIIGKSLGF